MKAGLIRCIQTDDICNTTLCLKAVREKTGSFADIDDVEIICVNTCGGCPGKKAVSRAAEMARVGAEAIILSSCMYNGSPIGFKCPNYEKIKKSLKENLPNGVIIIDGSH